MKDNVGAAPSTFIFSRSVPGRADIFERGGFMIAALTRDADGIAVRVLLSRDEARTLNVVEGQDFGGARVEVSFQLPVPVGRGRADVRYFQVTSSRRLSQAFEEMMDCDLRESRPRWKRA